MSNYIFNSLGVQYSWSGCFQALGLLITANSYSTEKLKEALSERFDGEVYLTYKGREAIQVALHHLPKTKSYTVLTQAFSCKAIEDAIVSAGYKPGYVDIEPASTNLSVKTLKAALKKFPDSKAVIVQHSLGLMADSETIRNWCDKHRLVMIEDMAQGFGAQDEFGKEAGTWGDITICSFGRDKILDSVSGGACIVRNDTLKTKESVFEYDGQVSHSQVIKDMFYPLITACIRSTLPIGVGKVVFQVAKQLGLLVSPVSSPHSTIKPLPLSHSALALKSLSQVETQLQHRHALCQSYYDALENISGLNILEPAHLKAQSGVRVCVELENPEQVAEELEKHHVYISDRWYRSPVDGGKGFVSQFYESGSCPEAELRTQRVLNLPTHRLIDKEVVSTLCSKLETVVK